MFTDKNVHIVQAKTADDVVKESNRMVEEHEGYDIADMIVCRKTDIVYFIDIPEGHSYLNVLRLLPKEE